MINIPKRCLGSLLLPIMRSVLLSLSLDVALLSLLYILRACNCYCSGHMPEYTCTSMTAALDCPPLHSPPFGRRAHGREETERDLHSSSNLPGQADYVHSHSQEPVILARFLARPPVVRSQLTLLMYGESIAWGLFTGDSRRRPTISLA